MSYWQEWFNDCAVVGFTGIAEHAVDGWPAVPPDGWGALCTRYLHAIEEAKRIAAESDSLGDPVLPPGVHVPSLVNESRGAGLLHVAMHSSHHLRSMLCPACGATIQGTARFCHACGQPMSPAPQIGESRQVTRAQEDAASQAVTRPTPPSGRTPSSSSGWLTSSDSIGHGRFAPGSILDDRYRDHRPAGARRHGRGLPRRRSAARAAGRAEVPA